MGFITNLQKFVLNPFQILEFLGLCMNYVTMPLTLLKGKLTNLKQKSKKLIQNSKTTIEEVASQRQKLFAKQLQLHR